VDGNRHLADGQVLAQARIKHGANILSVNLSAARKRLLAQPWIAEARISRKIPDGIEIRITEHRAAAIVDVGRRFLIDEQGIVFKELSGDDPQDLPKVVGLKYADLKLVSGKETFEQPADNAGRREGQIDRYRLMNAVIAVLKLGVTSASVVPTREIRQIKVDRQLGITLIAFDPGRPIKLGFDNYAAKYMVLKQVMVMLKQNSVRGVADYRSVDLIDINRIVVRPRRNVHEART
jgi:cell division protein FtsQ